jgi:hypothetical protein
LNCHPSCRVQAKRTHGRVQCETDQFDTDPISFLQRAYCVDENEDMSLEPVRNCRSIPDYMVTFSHYMTEEVLEMLQYEPYCFQIVDRFPNHLRGIQIQGLLFGTKTYRFGDGIWSTLPTSTAANDGDTVFGNDNDRMNTIHNDTSATVLLRNQYEQERNVYQYQTVIPGILDVNWDAVLLLARKNESQCISKPRT